MNEMDVESNGSREEQIKTNPEVTKSKNFMIESILSSPSQSFDSKWKWSGSTENEANYQGLGFCPDSSGDCVSNGQNVQEVVSTSSEECTKFEGECRVQYASTKK